MSALLNFKFLTLILFVSVNGKQDEDLCPSTRFILCIKDVLLNIVNTTKEIKSIVNKIEQDILRHESIKHNFNIFIKNLTRKLHKTFPTSNYHHQFMVMNNVDKTFFFNLIKEENYAFSYLYNSIQNILILEDRFHISIDKSFKKILNILRENILCNYRNILYAHSEKWISLDKITGIQIRNSTSLSSSILHDSHSIVIARLLRQWIERTDNILHHLETKLY